MDEIYSPKMKKRRGFKIRRDGNFSKIVKRGDAHFEAKSTRLSKCK